jgi:hypothetical protein
MAKAIVTVSEMARMVGLSRARFYELVRGGVFPAPSYQAGRPVYTAEMQEVRLEVRKGHKGVNGEPVLFYARRRPVHPTRTQAPRNKDVATLLEGLNALGLTTATAAQVEKVTTELFPNGTTGLDQGEVLKRVFLHLKQTHRGASQ